MPELVEQMYCSQQIVIPPKFPYILKRYCKAAIKTQPYDLLRWSYEYFTALAEHRPPPVKLRLEYPIYSTEGGLTRGCLKVLANQLSGMTSVPLPAVRQAWRGFCLDTNELNQILCLCEVYMREEEVSFLRFIAVAGGLLTKTLTHTMILLCETLTHEPDGGSAAIPVQDFLVMYRFLAAMDASKDVKYLNGYREGETPKTESTMEEEEQVTSQVVSEPDTVSDEYWGETKQLQKLNLTNDLVPQTTRLSLKLNMPALGKIERSPSMERAGQIERENYMRERKGRAAASDDVDQKLRQMSGEELPDQDKKDRKEEKTERKKEGIEIVVHDEDGNEIPYEIYGEHPAEEVGEEEEESNVFGREEFKVAEKKNNEIDKIKEFLDDCEERRLERIADLEKTFEEIEIIVDRFKSANYDLGMVAGRQMSTTSGEFIVAQVERDIMDYINEQIAILPDPDLKKKKAKPEEVAMIKELVENYLDENMEVIVPEVEEVEEEELPIPEVTVVYAVPGIGPEVDEDLVQEVEYYLLDVCKVQADMVMPRNIRHFLCPPLEKYKEHDYDNLPSKEELAAGGALTD
ncbi:uncharacterized protein LOC116776551 isoform X1 [Danaus plexippus]|uniref:uncharacterized protein LOC116776551 isoform X1 n=1 Tax=Danaus plexippus TaxID=13037 RepID=UPI002AB0632B|nr:uncharacterized protein LOC116776551 isoform X1 [Danaus plexippus]